MYVKWIKNFKESKIHAKAIFSGGRTSCGKRIPLDAIVVPRPTKDKLYEVCAKCFDI